MDFRASSLPYHFDWSETDDVAHFQPLRVQVSRGGRVIMARRLVRWLASHPSTDTPRSLCQISAKWAFLMQLKGESRKPKTRCWSGIDWNLRYRLIADSKRLTDRLRSIARSLRLPLHLHRQHSRRGRAEHLLPRLPVTSHRPQLVRHHIVEANRRWTLRELRHSLCGGLRRSMRRVGWAQAASVHKPEDHPSLNTTILCLTPAVSVTESVVR
jgi:hypothetical protein